VPRAGSRSPTARRRRFADPNSSVDKAVAEVPPEDPANASRLNRTAMAAAMRMAADYRAVFLGFMSSPWVQGPESWMQGQLSGFQGIGAGVVDSPRHLFECHSFGSPSGHERMNRVSVTQWPNQGENVFKITVKQHSW
jgi:hypothetical protein